MGTMEIKIQYEDISQELKDALQHEIDSINDNQNPKNLYNNIVSSTGTVGTIANIFGVPFGLVLKLKEINDLV